VTAVGDSNGIKIIQTVASGGTAVLHKAVQTSLDRIVAVKRLHQHLTEDENFTRRFILEAKAAASLDHENIVHVIDFGRGENGYEIVMEFVEGDSLKEVLERWRPIRPDLALAVVHQICLGLEHAHAKGIVHRDIKPGNVMLTRTGRAKITDFGLAKLTESLSSYTADDSIIGTPLYMSPEQAFGESVDQRSDLFSLGTVLYELVTGRQPFASENYMGVIQNIINKDIPKVRELNPDVPTEVEEMVEKALSKDRNHRFQSAREFREAIESYVGIAELARLSRELSVLLEKDPATRVLPRPAVEYRPKPRPRSGRGLGAIVVIVVLLGGAAVVVTHPEIAGRITGSEGYGPPPSNAERSEAVLAPVDAPFDLGSTIDGLTVSAAESTGAAASTETTGATADAGPASRAETPRAEITPEQTPPAATTETPARPASVVRTGFLSVNASPGAEVYIDGVYRGDTPPALRLELTSGPHSLECRRPQHETYRESLRITTGELSRRSVTLKELTGIIRLTTQEGAEVYIDGKLVGVTPMHGGIELAAGEHQVTIKKYGFNAWSSQVTIQPKKTLPLNITLSRRF